MWSLPDITRMNSEAYQLKKKLERAVQTGVLDRKRLKCEWADHDSPSKCEGDLRCYLWFDIFSDDPKGILTLCEHHDGYYGSPSEGFFECEGCQKVMVENYTWEYYFTDTDAGRLCLPCAAKNHLADPDSWIQLADERIDALTFDDIRKAKHIIGVEMPTPKGIEFVDCVTFDSMDGHGLDGGVDTIQDYLRALKEQGEDRAVVIMDGAYQFAVRISVYRETAEARDARRAESAVVA